MPPLNRDLHDDANLCDSSSQCGGIPDYTGVTLNGDRQTLHGYRHILFFKKQ